MRSSEKFEAKAAGQKCSEAWLLHVENIFGRQRRRRALQPSAVEEVVWIHSILTNKPNSPIVQMNVNNLSKMNYTIFAGLTKVKNKPNSNPIKLNSNPICQKPKMNTNIYYTKEYNNELILWLRKQSQSKPNSNPIQACPRMSLSGAQFQTIRPLMGSRKYKLYLTLPLGVDRIRYDTEIICCNLINEKGFRKCL